MTKRRTPPALRHIMNSDGDYIGTRIPGTDAEYMFKIGGSARDKSRARKSKAPRIAILITIGVLLTATYFLVSKYMY